ncbi:HAL/PAL/TAL family ammonia-lyase [Streptomyces nigra]|uniref:HAL/PAL/TAL family ammonia-lyase n=1 Tax=Streptomyces nigra TaxID=1827580 RepID=UPI00364DC9C1
MPDAVVAKLSIDGRSLSIDDIAKVALGGIHVQLTEDAVRNMRASVTLKKDLVAGGQAIYGVTTGFGDSVIRQIEPAKAAELQRNLVRYHVNGTGPQATAEVVRATMLIRANCLARGSSGIRPAVVHLLLDLLNNDVLPLIPERGSVGASGDLVPLCHLSSALVGEGLVTYGGEVRATADVMAELALSPVELQAKEGLALINGTSFSSAFAALATARAAILCRVAESCTALAVEALVGNRGHFSEFIHNAKPHPGQIASAAAVFEQLSGSTHALDHEQVLHLNTTLDSRGYAELPRPIQDRYSLRCAPHVIGVLRDTLAWVRPWVEVEVNSSNDNPLFDSSTGRVHSGGNFYGGHIAQAMDSLKVALASTADLLDRQMEHVVDEKFNRGLPPNLVPWFEPDEWRAGLHHGFKGMQIAASAITAEALKNSAPASVFSRSTEAHNQDKVSMSAIAARDARTVVELVEEVAAIHLLALCQAIDLRGFEGCAPATREVHRRVRAVVPQVRDDRAMEQDIHLVLDLIRSGLLTSPLPAAEGTPSLSEAGGLLPAR